MTDDSPEQLTLAIQYPPRKTITTVYYDQRRLMRDVMTLYELPTIDADVTYGRGALYPDVVVPRIRADLFEPPAGGVRADCRFLPLPTGSLHSIIFDPPWVAHTSDAGIMDGRYGHVRNIRDSWRLYRAGIQEAARVLERGGYLIVKCQDQANRDGNRFTHVKVYQYALEADLRAVDILLHIHHSPLASNITRQRFARKNHTYFWVFRKPKTQGPRPADGFLR